MNKKNPLKPLKELTIDEYFIKVIKLVKSMVFKIDDIFVNYNYHNFVKYGHLPIKPEVAKYYLNLAGKLEKNDKPVKIKSILYDNEVDLTRDLLDKDFLLNTVLSKYDTEYDTLAETYPTMFTYIQGCFLDLDLKDILSAKNYSLLYADTDYLNNRELNILKDAEYFVRSMFTTWFNVTYLIDEFYLPGFLNQVYQGLTVYILVKKLERTFTHEVDEFHLYNFLNSYKHIAKYLEVFDDGTKLWLYGNLDRIKKFTGQNKILDLLLKKVYDRNKYGIGNITLNQEKSSIIADNVNTIDKKFIERNYKYIAKSANETFYNIKNETFNITELDHMLRENKTIPDFYKLNDKLIDTISSFNKQNESRTKNFILDRPEKIKQYYFNRKTFAFSNMLHVLKKNNFNINPFDYLNLFNNTLYKLTAKDIYYLLIYGFILFENIKLDKFKFITEGVFEYPDRKMTIENTWHKDLLDGPLFDFIYPKELTLNNFPNFKLIKFWFSYVNEIEPKSWYLISNLTDVSLKSDISLITNNGFHSEIIDVDRSEVTSYLKSRNLDNFFPKDFNNTPVLHDLLISLLEELTGIDLQPEKIIYEMFNDLKQFFIKTTSYSVILLTDFNFKDDFISNNQKPSVNLDYKPYTEIKDGDFVRSNLLPVDMYGIGFTEVKPYYYKSHWEGNVSTLINTDKYFMYNEIESLKYNATPNTIIYARRFGIEYKVENSLEYIKNNETIKTGYSLKTISTDIIEVPETVLDLPNPVLKEMEINSAATPKSISTPTKSGVDYNYGPTIQESYLENMGVTERLGKYRDMYIIPSKIGWFKPITENISSQISATTNFNFIKQEETPTRVEVKQILNREDELVTIYEKVYPEEYKIKPKDNIAVGNDQTYYFSNFDNNTSLNSVAQPLISVNLTPELTEQQFNNTAAVTYNLGKYKNILKFKSKALAAPANDNITITKITRDKQVTIGRGSNNLITATDKVNNAQVTITKQGYTDKYNPTFKPAISVTNDKTKQLHDNKVRANLIKKDILGDDIKTGYDNEISNLIKSVGLTSTLGKFNKVYKLTQKSKFIHTPTEEITHKRSVFENIKLMNEKDLAVIETQNKITNAIQSYTMPSGYGTEYKPTSKIINLTDESRIKPITNDLSKVDVTTIGKPILNNALTTESNVNEATATSSLSKYTKILTLDSKATQMPANDNITITKITRDKRLTVGKGSSDVMPQEDRVGNETATVAKQGYMDEYKPTSKVDHLGNNNNIKTVDNKNNKTDVTPISNPTLNSVDEHDINNTNPAETTSLGRYKKETYNTDGKHLTSKNTSPKYTTGVAKTYNYGTNNISILNSLEEINNYNLNDNVTKLGYGKIYKVPANNSDTDNGNVQQNKTSKSTDTSIVKNPETISDTDNTSNNESSGVTN